MCLLPAVFYRSADKKSYMHTVLCSGFQHQLHIATTSVTLCGRSRATTSMHSMCMMLTLMLEQLVTASIAALTRSYTYTLCCVADFSIMCTLQPLV